MLKGIAILLMLIHHAFTFPEWIVVGYTPNPAFAHYLNSPTKLCVGIFAFITGWAVALDAELTIKKAGKKILKLLFTYWIVCILVMMIAVGVCGYRPSILNVVGEFAGINRTLMVFCWYVPFYIESMLLLCISPKAYDRNIALGVVTGIVLPKVVFMLLARSFSGTLFEEQFANLRHWYPCIAVGYLCNRYNIFSYCRDLTKKIPKTLLLIAGMSFCAIGRYFSTTFDFIYCAVLVFSIADYMNQCKSENKIGGMLIALGKHSLNMWLIHCVYFTPITREVFQPFIYWPRNGLLVCIVFVIELTVMSAIVNKVKILLLRFFSR